VQQREQREVRTLTATAVGAGAPTSQNQISSQNPSCLAALSFQSVGPPSWLTHQFLKCSPFPLEVLRAFCLPWFESDL